MAGIQERDIAVLVVLAIDDADRSLRANLLAPIAVCAESRVRAQIILDPNKYGASVPLGGSPDQSHPAISSPAAAKSASNQLQHG